MSKIVALVILLPVIVSAQSGGIDQRFHTLAEIYTQLETWQSQYPQIMVLDTIGYSTNEQIPLIAAKISDNPGLMEDEPRLLLIGQHHAEEILGVEIVLGVMQDLLENAAQSQQFRAYIQHAELWFLPTMNPEGLNVVMSGRDVTYRKNLTDNNGNGQFDFEPGIGGDVDGVDFNRNYDFCWMHGDSLYEGDMDYYRGPDAFSESETRAVAQLALEQHFLYSFSYHSARSGEPEVIYYPWNFGGSNKKPPDYDVIRNLANSVASRILRQDGVNHYRTFNGTSRLGNAHNWMYARANTIQLLIEVGTNNLQPDSAEIEQVVARNKEGVYYLFDRTIGYYEDKFLLTGHVTDALTASPLDAEITIQDKNAPYLEHRISDILYGRYWRPLLPGTYSVKVCRMGYYPVIRNVTVGAEEAVADFALEPRPQYDVSWMLRDSETGDTLGNMITLRYLPARDRVSLFDKVHDPIQLNQMTNSALLDSGLWRYEAQVPGNDGEYLTRVDTVLIQSDSTIIISMPRQQILLDETFTSLENWTSAGHWAAYQQHDGKWSVKTQGGMFYRSNEDETVQFNGTVDLSSHTVATLTLTSWQEMEWGTDSATVEVRAAGATVWHPVLGFSEQPDSGGTWSMEHQQIHAADLTKWTGQEIELRLHFRSDASLQDRGWHITHLMVTGGTIPVSAQDEPAIPHRFQMLANYPNPFNASTVIEYEVPGPGEVSLRIYNLLGQKVFQRNFSAQDAGKYNFRWDGETGHGFPAPSGMYFARIRWQNRTSQQKLLLLR